MGFQIVLLYVREFSKCFTVREWVSSVFYRTCVSFPRALPYVSEFPLCLTVRDWVSPMPYCTCVSSHPCLTVHEWVSPVSYRTCTWLSFPCALPHAREFSNVFPYVSNFPHYRTSVSLPCTLPYVCECPLGLSLVSYRTWLSFPSDLLHASLPFILPYVSEFPHCYTVREWVSPVTYCTWVFPLSLCTLVNFHSILQCVSFPSVLLHVCKFPYWSTLREFQCLTVREFP